jgi:glycosyltransferase involved in cell wall biosynthesis
MGIGNVLVPGFVPHRDVPGCLAAADVLVLPYLKRIFSAEYMSPLKLFEYMAACRPIVASDLPALRTVLRHEENALLCEPDSVEALAAAVRRVLADADLGRRLADRAREDVQSYTWDRRAKTILENVRRWMAEQGHG